jgi:hypothetical protein
MFSILLMCVAAVTAAVESPAMPKTLLGMSQKVAQSLARPDLVVDYAGADFTPKSDFLEMINDAHRHLDRLHVYDHRMSKTKLAIAQGQYQQALPERLRYIEHIDLEDASGNIVPNGGLKQRDELWLRDKYDQTFELVTQGEPQYWARAAGVQVETLRNPDFDTSPIIVDELEGLEYLALMTANPGLWVAQGGVNGDDSAINWLWSNGLLSIDTYSSPSSTPVVGQYVGNVAAGDVTVTVGLGAGGGTVLVTIYSSDGATYEFVTLSSATTLTHVFEDLGAWNVIQVANMGGTGTVIDSVSLTIESAAPQSLPSIRVPWFITMPPADAAYTAVIHHGQYATELVANDDESWWSYNHPDILATGIKRQVAVDKNRNATEVKKYDEKIETDLAALHIDVGEEDFAGPDVRLRFGWRPR